ncbi:MAG: ABC transporter permease [Planctomycetota bacterium]
MSQPLLDLLRADRRHPQVAPQGAAVSHELIRLENITKTYHLGEVEVPVLKGVSLSIARGEMVALMGASGSGKTTLMNILGCLDRPSSGHFWFDGQEMSRLSPNERAIMRTTKLGFVFQSFNLLPRMSALHNVLMPLDYALRRPARGEASRLAESLLQQVGLATRMDHEPSQMSGGQQQRVAIARALVNCPALLLADEPTGNLDSRTGDEILRMFQRLHTQGITVILVTHDAKVAAYADRTIHIADGLIANDLHWSSDDTSRVTVGLAGASFKPEPSPRSRRGTGSLHQHLGDGVALSAANEAQAATLIHAPHARGKSSAQEVAEQSGLQAETESPPAQPKSFAAGSLIPPTLRMALGNLRRNKMRSALTALGVIIGVGAVIAMTEIGQGSKAAIEKTIASMGAYKLPIFPAAANNGGVSRGAGTLQTLKPGDVDEIARQCPAVTVVVPMVWAQAQVVRGKRNWAPKQLTGTTPGYLATRDWEDLEEGDCFTEDDVRSSNAVCLIGATVNRELFEEESPIGKMIRIRNVPFRVIGLLSPRGANMMGQDQDDCIIAPWTTIKFRVNSLGAGSTNPGASASSTSSINSLNNPYPAPTPLYPQASAAQLANTPQAARQTSIDMIQGKAANAEQVPVAIEQITALLRERHHLTEGQDDDFKILNMTEIARTSARTAELMGALLLTVAAISLVVGGVGIMNIMLVSVTERTREIGLRMAVGARQHHILQQFLVEAVLLCLAGGALGILAGRGTSVLVREIQHWTTEICVPAIVISVIVAGGVGMVFGFYPAWKASRLDPIEALRHE